MTVTLDPKKFLWKEDDLEWDDSGAAEGTRGVKYSPSQPRAPEGTSIGGEWVPAGGGEAGEGAGQWGALAEHIASESEALAWARGGKVPGFVYSATKPDDLANMLKHGIRTHTGESSQYGHGVYFADRPLPQYGPVVLKAGVRLKSPYVGGLQDLDHQTTLAMRGGPPEHEVAPGVRARFWDKGDRNAAITAYFRSKGHDGVVVEDAIGKGHPVIVAFDASSIKIVATPELAAQARDVARRKAVKYSPDQPRVPSGDPEGGEWTSEGGGSGGQVDPRVSIPTLTKLKEGPFDGKPRPQSSPIGKQDTGKIAENVTLAYLRQFEGAHDAQHMNGERNNFPVDLAYDHKVVEVKGGRIDNSPKAQQWRLTIGQPGKEEASAMRGLTSEQLAAYNQDKSLAIIERKKAIMRENGRALGHPITARTMTAILDHDRRRAYLYSFDGLHPRIAWTGPAAREGYIGAFEY